MEELMANLITIVVVLAMMAVVGFIWWKVFSKAGYHGALGLLMFVPIVNLGMLVFFAVSDWPVLKELRQLKGAATS